MQRYGRFVKLQETWVEKFEEITSFKVLLSVLPGGLDKTFSKAGKISFLRARDAARRVRGERAGAWQDTETDLAASGGVSACGQVRIGGRRLVRISVPLPSAYACRRSPDRRRRGASG